MVDNDSSRVSHLYEHMEINTFLCIPHITENNVLKAKVSALRSIHGSGVEPHMTKYLIRRGMPSTLT
jgi:hypothetical protein